LPRYRPGAPTVVNELREPAAKVRAVAANAFHVDEPGVLAALVDVLDGVPCVEIESGDLGDACDAVLTRLAQGDLR
jgi:hypothetical protein